MLLTICVKNPVLTSLLQTSVMTSHVTSFKLSCNPNTAFSALMWHMGIYYVLSNDIICW